MSIEEMRKAVLDLAQSDDFSIEELQALINLFKIQKKRHQLESLCETAAGITGATVEMMFDECKFHEVVIARWLVFAYYRNIKGLTYKAIGSRFNGIDHATVMYGVSRLTELVEINDSEIVDAVDEFKNALNLGDDLIRTSVKKAS